ncbi:MAG: hypothetical protein ACRDYC_10145, partial [Acidimicrobiales bacterium]
DIECANFAQKMWSLKFGEGKKNPFRDRPVKEVAAEIHAKTLPVRDVKINVIVKDGNTLILNTRSAQALMEAGVPRSQWNVINRTGNRKYEGFLDDQLRRNGLTSEGYPNPQPRGSGQDPPWVRLPLCTKGRALQSPSMFSASTSKQLEPGSQPRVGEIAD